MVLCLAANGVIALILFLDQTLYSRTVSVHAEERWGRNPIKRGEEWMGKVMNPGSLPLSVLVLIVATETMINSGGVGTRLV